MGTFRGFGIGDYARRNMRAPCDFWVPDPGFVAEFDESQHFTSPRNMALAVYADVHPRTHPVSTAGRDVEPLRRP